MKVAITGKGGVGKTTIAAALCHTFSLEGKRVLAVDADPDSNLASALGIGEAERARIKPIAELVEVIEERTGAKPGSSGGIFKLNPRVDDIPDEFGLRFNNIVLLVTGKSKEASAGCYCPENVFLRRLLRHIVIERNEVVVLDMEAGIEHLTRGTAEAVDAFIIVVEPGSRSIQTANTIKRMAGELGVKRAYVVANKVRTPEDLNFIKNSIGDLRLIGKVGYDPKVIEADIEGRAPFTEALMKEIGEIKRALETEK